MEYNFKTNEPLVIAIDSSTTSTKAIVVNPKGEVIAESKHSIPMLNPTMDFYEHNPLHWWESTSNSIANALSKLSDEDRARVAAIGITHQRESFGCFDANGQPIRNGILWLDARAKKQIRQYGSKEVHDLSGKPPGEPPAIYKLAWLKENEAHTLDKAHKIVDVAGYLNYCLTGHWLSSEACADTLGMLDICNRKYADPLLEIAGVRAEQMADLVEPGEAVGLLKPEWVSAWNLSRTIPVIAGCGDGMAAALGSAAVTPDIAYLNLGTAVVAGVPSTHYKSDSVFRTYASGIKNNYIFEVVQHSGAHLTSWFREALGDPQLKGEPDPALDAEAAKLPPGCDGLITLPYWDAVQSPYWDPIARGTMIGWKASHTRAHMYRSILEAIAFEVQLNLEHLQEKTGTPITKVHIMGGGSRSKLWRQIVADVTGKPVIICAEDEISALGAAIQAMASTGYFGNNDIAYAAKKMARFSDTVQPDMEKHQQYKDVAAIQRKLYPRLKDLFAEIQELSEKYA